eukprot:7384995-Prymnesium_polylepis.2
MVIRLPDYHVTAAVWWRQRPGSLIEGLPTPRVILSDCINKPPRTRRLGVRLPKLPQRLWMCFFCIYGFWPAAGAAGGPPPEAENFAFLS